MWRWLRLGCAGLAVGYLAIVVALYGVQRSLLYGSEINRMIATPASAGLNQAQAQVLMTPDGEVLSAWYVAPSDDRKPVYLYFHGKEGSLRQRARRIKMLSGGGIGVLAIDYRGFGGSTGSPTEEGLFMDGEAAYHWLRDHVEAERIIILGESLGTGVAVWLAARQPAAALILQSPFTSAVDIAALRYPLFPVRLLMKDQFLSDRLINSVHMPLLIQHGGQDTVIPVRFGKQLFSLANEPKRFLLYPTAGHDLWQYGADADAATFVSEIRGESRSGSQEDSSSAR